MQENVYFLFRAGLPGDALRQPKQCRTKQDVIVSYKRGVILAQVREGGLCATKCVFFYSEQGSLGTFCANKNHAG